MILISYILCIISIVVRKTIGDWIKLTKQISANEDFALKTLSNNVTKSIDVSWNFVFYKLFVKH